MQKLTTLPALAAQAYDALALPVWLFSSETLNIVAANKAAQTWLGYDEQTLKTMTVADLRPESERELVADRVRRFNDVQGHAGTWTIIAKSGDRYTVSFHWTKVLFDGAPTIVASIQDITQATQVQAHARTLAANIQALQTKVTLTTEHFARLFDAVPGKMLVLTPNDYTIVAVTDDYAKAVSSDRTTLIGRRLFEAFPDDPNEPDADGTRNLMASLQRVQALNTTDVMAIQRYPVRTPDGTFQERFWLPLNKLVFDNQGKLLYIIHRAEDVTTELSGSRGGEATADAAISHTQRNLQLNPDETRATLLALKERETQLRQTLESIGDAFYLLDNSWHFSFLNKHAEKLLQRRSADLLGKLVWTEFPDVVGTIFQTDYQRAVREQQTVHFQNFYPALETWFDVSAYPTPQGLAVYFRDITRHGRSHTVR